MSFPRSLPDDLSFSRDLRHPRSLGVGTGRATAHHGEILQGVFTDDDERLHRGLITLPCPSFESVATFWPDERNEVRTRPAGMLKAARAARLTFEALGQFDAGGCLTIESKIPMSLGYGSSTADVVATIRAVSAAMGVELNRAIICRLAVAAETASDSIVFGPQAVLFAQREGHVIEYLPGDYPPLLIVGFISPNDVPVDTLTFAPARYDRSEIESFRVLRGLARKAILEQNVGLLGHVATASARINQRYLPKTHLADLLRLAENCGALGVQIAHSGNRMGLLMDARDPDVADKVETAAKTASKQGFTNVHQFAVNLDVQLLKEQP
ncbi:kinase [Ochrobactrum vermis]|uniref:Kinase n=1 Tax=Ochrobactrum vermis TaxID=1827297 RepID=A0ABU8PFY3_9HYPH|nr:kinase [Ochrobactrum vermis]PQZ27086.1 kinase [Ochrobactrum vermis]